jgi:hypothetical protein
MLALEKARSIGVGRYIISATTPFSPDDVHELTVARPTGGPSCRTNALVITIEPSA